MIANDMEVLSLYSAKVKRYTRLSKEQEFELFTIWNDTKDPKVREKIIHANLLYAVTLAWKFRNYSGISIMDLVSEGNLGLLVAFDKFELRRGIRFITYARHWALAYMTRYIAQCRIGGRGCVNTKYFYNAVRHTGTAEDLAEKSGMGVGTARQLLGTISDDISIDACIELKVMQDFDASLVAAKRSDVLSKAVKETLTEKEEYILAQRFMLDKPRTQASIGRELKCCRENVRQLEVRAKDKLKQALDGTCALELL